MIKLFSLIFLFVSLASADAGKSSFHELLRFKFGGIGGWDYLKVEETSGRLFIARSDRVMVIDAETGKLITEIPGMAGAHGVAFDLKHELGFATAGKANAVVVFDLKTLKPSGSIPVGENPDAIIYDEFSNHVFAFNGKSKMASVIDAATRKVVATISLSGKPEFAVSDEAGKIFVNIEDQNSLTVIDSTKNQILTVYSLKPCEEPTGLSYDPENKRLIAGCGNKLAAVVSAETGKVLQTFPVGEGVDATAFDTKSRRAFISAGLGSLTVLDAAQTGYTLLQTLDTVRGARTLAVNSKTGKVYLPSATLTFPKDSRPVPEPGTFYVMVVGQK